MSEIKLDICSKDKDLINKKGFGVGIKGGGKSLFEQLYLKKDIPLTIEEIIFYAKKLYPQSASEFSISKNPQDDTITFKVAGYEHTETIDKLCEAEVNGTKVPKRPAMVLNLCVLFSEMDEILNANKN